MIHLKHSEVSKLKLNGCQLLAAFPGVGKTHLAQQHQDKVTDSDSSKFKASWPHKYIEHIMRESSSGKIVFISTHKEVLTALSDMGIKCLLVVPDESLKDEYLARYASRGSPPAFVKLLRENWHQYIKDCTSSPAVSRTLVLHSGMYLSDVVEVSNS